MKRAVREKGQASLHLRDAFVPDFVAGLNSEDREAFLEVVVPILRDSLTQKEIWLQIAGSLDYARWSPALSLTAVTDVRWSGEKDVTGWIASDCEHPIRFILRWGKEGQPLSLGAPIRRRRLRSWGTPWSRALQTRYVSLYPICSKMSWIIWMTALDSLVTGSHPLRARRPGTFSPMTRRGLTIRTTRANS